jgi:hypothetical protein
MRRSLGILMLMAGRLDSARATLAPLAERDTVLGTFSDRTYWAMAAAAQGDTTAALQVVALYDSLARLPYDFGRSRYAQARITAMMGRHERAVQYLRQALSAGMPFGPGWHTDPAFRSMHNYPPFKEVLRPKG